MKKHVLLAVVLLSLAFSGFSQKDPNNWTVTNLPGSASTCTYDVCLLMAIRNISTQVVSSSSWVCHTIAPGSSAIFSLLISPATGYEIVVIDAKATYNGTSTHTGLSLTGLDIRSGACNSGSGWVTFWQYTGPHSFSINQDLAVGM